MANLKSIKKRIGSVKNTRQITKAMKMVSAAKLRRAQDAIVAARPYADKMTQVLAGLALREDPDSHPLLKQREQHRALIVLMTGDRGLCGGFNANVSKMVERYIRANAEGYEQIDLMIIGRKGNDYLKRRPGLNIVKVYEHLTGSISYSTAALLGQEIIELYKEEQYDVVHLAYNAFRSAISQVPTMTQVLPIVPRAVKEDEFLVDYIFEPSRGEVLEQILPKNVEVQIFRSLLESVASEHGARMSAMDSASKNANQMIGRLTLEYNRARQAAITKELMEIISGAEAIK
ncbi:ATP synthase F1 subunit gamma [Geoalkalibacter halelectricus]|uniref:ATP synthase gamma chain n=1 Tax=Geoalkalibacter halelectricus TaxID=2847045 RepID=A0ABY5ZSJ8_9BACT|nr:ATP synthase F1 subunit gamma [Geoalkalibacter halelectricus]MDO3378469.1 ATP synthase F1 subunit gamma [Geoalkalibacter halelectricus]UWZ80211.1 ATP synthase F1 subunit gamma [Geoalkalibacter halelectricus]